MIARLWGSGPARRKSTLLELQVVSSQARNLPHQSFSRSWLRCTTYGSSWPGKESRLQRSCFRGGTEVKYVSSRSEIFRKLYCIYEWHVLYLLHGQWWWRELTISHMITPDVVVFLHNEWWASIFPANRISSDKQVAYFQRLDEIKGRSKVVKNRRLENEAGGIPGYLSGWYCSNWIFDVMIIVHECSWS